MALGCTSAHTAHYEVGLFRVERLPPAAQPLGAVTMTSEVNNGRSRVVMEDSLIRVDWDIVPFRLGFRLTNKTDRPLAIIWDDAAFLDVAGVSHKVIHRGVRYEDLDKPQRPTTVGPSGRVTDIVLPTQLIYYRADVGWLERPILSPYRTASEDELTGAKANVGRSFGVVLPIDLGDSVRNYVFTFRVNAVTLPNER